MNILLTDFIKQYPTCPLCNGELFKNEEEFIFKYDKLKFLDFRCKEGHYQLHFDRFLDQKYSEKDVQISSITFLTAFYDISILLAQDWIRIQYSPQIYNQSERGLACNDFTKWMIAHEEMLDKLNKLWSIS